MMDEIDRQIIAELRRNARVALEQVAKAVNLSRPSVHERVRRLEAKGVIQGYTAQLNWTHMGYPIMAFINVYTRGNVTELLQQMMRLSVEGATIEEIHRVTGDSCFLLKVRAASTLTLQDLLDSLRTHSALVRTLTTVVLSSLKEGTIEHDAPDPIPGNASGDHPHRGRRAGGAAGSSES